MGAELFDFRSDAGRIAPGLYRCVLNRRMSEGGKPCRSGGWLRLFGNSPYGFNNQDLHDPLLSEQEFNSPFQYQQYMGYYGDYCSAETSVRGGCREQINYLFEFINESGARKLIAFTQKRIYELNERGGNWRLLADGLGSPLRNISDATCQECAGPRWLAAQLLGYLIMTNGMNVPMSYKMGDGPSGCNLWSAQPISDLIDLGITKAGVVAQFKGFVLLADVDQEGIRRPGRVFWSDFNQPLSWLPLPGTSLAGFADVGFSETVMRMEPLGDYLMVYTDAAIYRASLVLRQETSGVISEVFHFTQIYRGPHALRYKYSLVNTGTEHIYAATDGLYVMNSFSASPQRIEWLHRADGAIYVGANHWSNEFTSLPGEIETALDFGAINQMACDNFIGGYNPLTKEVWFSWATDDNTCANVSIRINLNYESASIVDHGFSAFIFYRPDTRPTFYQWLEDLQVCLASEWDQSKQGEMQGEADEFENPVPYIWNPDEQFNQAALPDSLCGILGDTTLADICEGCPDAPVFIGASTADLTLKEFDEEIGYREFYNGISYSSLGFPSLIQSGQNSYGTEVEKTFSRVRIGYKAAAQTTPSLIYCDISFGAQSSCPTWKNVGSRELACLTERSAAQHLTNRTRPSLDANFPFQYRGKYLGWRSYILSTGGLACFESVDLFMRNTQTTG